MWNTTVLKAQLIIDLPKGKKNPPQSWTNYWKTAHFLTMRLNKLFKSRASELLGSIEQHCALIALETSSWCSLAYEMAMKMLMGQMMLLYRMCPVDRKRMVTAFGFFWSFYFKVPSWTWSLMCPLVLYDNSNSDKSQMSPCVFILYVYCVVVPPTTNVFTGLSESWRRTSDCPIWLLLNRRPTGSTVATLVLQAVTVCLL